MSEVQKFRADLCVRPIMAVAASDYDALAAELAEYKNILRMMVEESTCADWSGESDDSVRTASQTWCGRFHHFKQESERLAAELAALKGGSDGKDNT